MSNLQRWALGVWGQFTAGRILLGMIDGKDKFYALLWRNLVMYFFLILDFFIFMALVTVWFAWGNAFILPTYPFIILAILHVAFSIFLSVYDIPNFVPEKRKLDKVIEQANPIHVFIIIPIRWLRRTWTERRAS